MSRLGGRRGRVSVESRPLMPGFAAGSDSSFESLRGAAVCVTGGAGFIGTHLTRSLLRAGADVRVIDDLSASDSASIAAMIDDVKPGRLRFTHASILEPSALDEAVAGARVVFHLAALSSAAQAQEEPIRCMEVNGLGTARVAEAARRAGARRIVFAASASSYGDSDHPNRENQPPAPLSPYAASKLAGEHVVTAWARSRGLDGVSLRLFNVYGPGQSRESQYAAVIPIFAAALDEGAPPTIFGDGSQTRDFVHVRDVVRAFLLAGATDRNLEGAILNIGVGRSVTIRELASLMARLSGAPGVEPIFAEPRPGDIRASECDAARAREILGFYAQTPLEDGLAELLNGSPDVTRV